MRYLALILLAGCALPKHREPCEYDVHVRLTEEANAECHEYKMRDHKGNRVNNTSEVLGCASAGGIISNGTRSNLGHENMHVIEAECPKWVDWQ